MQAVVSTAHHGTELKQVPIPVPGQGEVLVKVYSAAQNPADWKVLDSETRAGLIIGFDFSGVVEKLGAGVTNLSIGTRVAGYVLGAIVPGQGSFAEFLVTDAALVWVVPSGTSFDEAAAIGGAGAETAIAALFNPDYLGLEHTPDNKGDGSKPVLIWGGATSVGQYAIQLLKASGYKVITTASPKNFDLVKSLGAVDVFDYKDTSTSKKIKEKYPDIKKALDCVSVQASKESTQASLNSGLIYYLSAPLLPTSNTNIEQGVTSVFTTRGKTFGTSGFTIEANLTHRKLGEDWLVKLSQFVADGVVKANKVTNLGGLDKVKDGLRFMRAGKVSAEKLVYTVAK